MLFSYTADFNFRHLPCKDGLRDKSWRLRVHIELNGRSIICDDGRSSILLEVFLFTSSIGAVLI